METSTDLLTGRDFSKELVYSATRSSGPGGQNVNKVSSKVELRFSIPDSRLLTDAEKQTLQAKLSTKISQEGFLILTSQAGRTQLKNKELVTERFYRILRKALTPVKPRKKTRPSAATREKRLESKRKVAERKELRKKI